MRKQKSNYLSMETQKSTPQEPLIFFQSMFIENDFQWYKASFFDKCEKYTDVVVDGNKVKYRDVSDAEVIKDFGKEFEHLLLIEQGKFIQNMNRAIDTILLEDKSPIPFLSRLHRKIVEILSVSKSEQMAYLSTIQKTIKYSPVSKDYPFVEGIINGIKQEIEKEQQYYTKEKSPILCDAEEELPPQTETIEVTQEESPKNKLIMEIFGFLNDGKYISNKDWEYLIAYLKSFIIEYKVPQIDKIFSLKRRHHTLIKFLFYVLYSNIQDSRGHQDSFSEFYIKAFEESTPTVEKIKSLSKKMSTKPPIKDDIPEIVKKYLL